MDTLQQLRTSLADRYRIERELGAGGMATVYLAHDLKHERDVAIKLLHPDLGAALGADRFLAEIKTTAKLQHPHILALLDSGAADGLLYYVMPYVRGETLRARLERERQLSIPDAVRIAREVAGALEHAHRQGIIHRDIKPENILLQDGAAVVADFGIALAVQQAGGARMTQTGLSLGTPQYMAPEQAMGERLVDARADIYALGAVTYEMLTGEPPFTGATVQSIVAKVMSERPTALRTVRDTIPLGVDAAVMTALAKLPADRFATAGAFAEALVSPPPAHGTLSGGTASRASRASVRAWQAATAIAIAAATVAIAMPRHVPSTHGVIVQRQLTFERGVIDVALSPDGAWLAYLKDDCADSIVEPCTQTLAVHEVDGSQAVRIATWPSIAPHLRWTGDGRALVFVGSPDRAADAVYVIDRLGGTPRRIAIAPTAMTVMPDGRTLVASVGPESQAWLQRWNLETLTRLDSARLPPGVRLQDIAASGDGRLAAIGTLSANTSRLMLLAPDGRLLDSLTLAMRDVVRWDPAGDAVMVFEDGEAGGVGDDLLRVGVRRDRFDRQSPNVLVGQVPTNFKGRFDVSANGRLALALGATQSEIVSTALADPARTWHRVVPPHGIHGGRPVFSADGKALVVAITDNIGENLYRYPLDGGAPIALTVFRGWDSTAGRWGQDVSVSPDGKHLAFVRGGAHGSEIAFIDVEGGRERRIGAPISGTGEYWRPVWLADDQLVASRNNQLVTIDTTGAPRDSVALPDSLGTRSGWGLSRPGERTVYIGVTLGPSVVAVDFRTHAVRLVARSSNGQVMLPVGWTKTGALALRPYSSQAHSRTLFVADDVSQRVRPFVDLPTPCSGGALDPSGANFACVRDADGRDVWLAVMVRR